VINHIEVSTMSIKNTHRTFDTVNNS